MVTPRDASADRGLTIHHSPLTIHAIQGPR
jgi:hypothetical protein